MKLESDIGTVNIDAPREFCAAQATAFLTEASAALDSNTRAIEIDLSGTRAFDGSAVGALLELHRKAADRSGDVSLRLLNPLPGIWHLLELARLHHVFEITGPTRTSQP